MGIDEIKELITSVGFPICGCVVLFYNNSKFTETLNNLNVTNGLLLMGITFT